MAVLGLRFCARAFSSCGKRGRLFIAVRGPLTIAAPPAAGHRLQTRRLSNCGARAQLLRGVWDLPRPGSEPVSPALAGRFSTTAPPGKPLIFLLLDMSSLCILHKSLSSEIWFASIFSCLWLVFSFSWTASTKEQKCFVWMKSIYHFFSFMVRAFGVVSEKSLPNQGFLIYFSRSLYF